jgi:hypothetical protein
MLHLRSFTAVKVSSITCLLALVLPLISMTNNEIGQLQKIGVLQSAKNSQTTALAAKRRSGQIDFSNLGPLKAGGTVGFSAFRDQEAEEARRRKARKKSNGNAADDSDDDDDENELIGKMEEVADKETSSKLAPEDAKFQGELADGVNRIHV